MPPLKQKSTEFLLEKNPSSAINTPSILVADYLSVPNTNYGWMLPDTDKVSDANRSGRNAATHECNDYWKQDDIEIADDLDFKIVPRIWRRAMGGVPVRTLVATGVFDYTWTILPPNVSDDLPANGFISKLGLAFFLWAGVKWNKVSLSQSGAARVTHNAVGFGTGKHTLNPFVASMPTIVTPDCLDGRKVRMSYVDEASQTVDLAALGGIKSWTVSHDSLLQKAFQELGDPSLAVEGVEAGYVREIPRGTDDEPYQSALSFVPSFKDLGDWKRTVKNAQMTNFSIVIPGRDKIATVSATDYYNEIEIKVDKFGFNNIGTGSEKGRATSPIGVTMFESPTHRQTFSMRLRTTEATFEGVSA